MDPGPKPVLGRPPEFTKIYLFAYGQGDPGLRLKGALHHCCLQKNTLVEAVELCFGRGVHISWVGSVPGPPMGKTSVLTIRPRGRPLELRVTLILKLHAGLPH